MVFGGGFGMTTPSELKRSRAEIAAQTEAFLKSGGKIKKIGVTKSVSMPSHFEKAKKFRGEK